MNFLRKIILSNKFLPVLFVFFALQSVVYASVIGFGVPSDEQYHFGATNYYAEQPITQGPFTENQPPETIRDIRHIDRSSSYLYHYLLSFFARAFNVFDIGRDTQILFLRLVNVAIALGSLYLVKKILDSVSKDTIVKNLSIAMFVLTGATVWLAGSINYDNLAILMWLGFLYLGIKFIQRPSLNLSLGLITLSFLTPITKFTYTPFMFVGLLMIFILSWHQNKNKIKTKSIKDKIKRPTTILLVLSVVFSLGLFTERVGLNLISYGKVQPKCDQFFTSDECRTNNVYNRGFEQQQKFSSEDQKAIVRDWDPFTHTGEWIYKMYNSLPWYLGHQRIESNNYSEIIAWLLAFLSIITALFSRKRLRINKSLLFVLSISTVYITGVFLRNLETYLTVGRMYAYQGRYLIPVLAFVYFLMIMLVVNSYRNMNARTKTTFSWLWLVVLAIYLLSHFTPFVFLVGIDDSWFREYIIEITP